MEGGEKERWEPLFEAEILGCQRCSFEGRGKEGVELDGVARSSDAFFPLPDNMHRARKSGVRYLAVPSGSVMDEECVKAADEHGIVFAHTSLRLFHH